MDIRSNASDYTFSAKNSKNHCESSKLRAPYDGVRQAEIVNYRVRFYERFRRS